MNAIDFSKLNISHADLQAYLDSEREAQERAKRDAMNAERTKALEAFEARREAASAADAAARAAGDPNLKAARLLADLLGDRLGDFVQALNRVSPPKFINALLKMQSERAGLARHQATVTAPQARADAEADAKAVRMAIVESELGRLGIYDVTPDEDAA